MDIIVYEEMQQKKSFYSVMGPYFASLDIKKELEIQLYNKPSSVWFLGYDGEELVGFCALFEENKKMYFDNFYVLPEHRGKGYGSALFKYRFDYTLENFDKKITVISKTPHSIHLYESYGFEHTGNRGRYQKYCYEKENRHDR